ncbi:MAG TPA: hypothetical protein VJ508_02090 [Saprospiraceae bacterium]|nr:hypothetical protein [Saprospiraceae bacterium]
MFGPSRNLKYPVAFLPETCPTIIPDKESFDETKAVSREVAGRNSALALIMINSLMITHQDIRIAYIESAHNTTSHYLAQLGHSFGTSMHLFPFSYGVNWKGWETDNLTFTPFGKLTDVVESGVATNLDVMFFDACGCPLTLVEEMLPAMNLLRRDGMTIFGVSACVRAGPSYSDTRQKLKSGEYSASTAALIKECGYYSSNRDKIEQWFERFLKITARRAGFTLSREWRSFATSVFTLLYVATPIGMDIGMDADEKFIVTPESSVMTHFWSKIKPDVFTAHNGMLAY